MASDPRDPGPAGGVFGGLPPSYTRSPPPVNSDLRRRPSYCYAAFALKQISKVTNAFPVENIYINYVVVLRIRGVIYFREPGYF